MAMVENIKNITIAKDKGIVNDLDQWGRTLKRRIRNKINFCKVHIA